MTPMTQAQRLSALVTANLAATITHTATNGKPVTYKLAKLAEKTGKMRDGSQGNHVILEPVLADGQAADSVKVLTLHPSVIDKLFANLKESGLELVDGLNTPEAVAVNDEAVAAAAAADKANKKAETLERQTKKKEADAAARAERNANKEPTKAERARAMFDAMTAAGKDRKEIIAAFKTDLVMSDQGANTYYQNCKQGAAAAGSAVASSPAAKKEAETATAE